MAGRSFTRHSNGVGNRIKAEHINELQVASEADDTRIDAKADTSALAAHESDTTNPHGVTASQLGLGNVADVDVSHAALTFVFDGQGETVEAGEVARVVMPYAATITGWRVIGSSAGTFAATVRRATFAAFPTMTTISGSDSPALSGAQKAEDTSLSGWTTALAVGDVVELLVTAATVPWVSVQIIMQRS